MRNLQITIKLVMIAWRLQKRKRKKKTAANLGKPIFARRVSAMSR